MPELAPCTFAGCDCSQLAEVSKEMTLTYNTHIPSYIQLDDMLLLTFRSLAAIVSEKSTVFTFSHRKA